MRNKYIILYLLLICSAAIGQGKKKRVLFIGNSYTYRNDMYETVSRIATSMGDILIYDTFARSGNSLEEHYNNDTLRNKIKDGGWDYVTLQEQSHLPSLDNATVAQKVFPYARSLDSLIKLSNPCSETIFYMTWGRENGLESKYCNPWPPVCTYRGMDSLLNLRYRMMAVSNGAILSPAGAIWNYIRKNFPDMVLYDDDSSHPSPAGSYVAACSYYTTIFRKNPALITYKPDTVSSFDAARIRYATKKVLYDSLLKWHIGEHDHIVNFNYEVNANKEISFTNTSVNAYAFAWDFGDGNVANTLSPLHIYAAAGVYNVKLIAKKYGCNRFDTVIKSISVTAVTGNMRTATEYACSGTLYDSGGPASNYQNSENKTLVISPAGAKSVTLTFSSFKTYDASDNLKIYSGNAILSDSLLKTYSGDLIAGTNVTAKSGVMTLKFVSNASSTKAGWDAKWTSVGGTCSAPVADFNAGSTVINEGNAIQFTSTSVNTPTLYSWKFEGGTPATAATVNPSITYTTQGIYAVSLTVTNAGGSNTKTALAYVKVNKSGPSAQFTANALTINAGDAVQFTNMSAGATSKKWFFKGAVPATSELENPVVIYPSPGVYTVSLNTANAGGLNSTTKVNYITVSAKVINMIKGKITTTACSGYLYDDGGINGNYKANQSDTLIIQPVGADSVTITFSSFKTYNSAADYLKIYDGVNVTTGSIKHLYGEWPANTYATAKSGKMALKFITNDVNFEVGWQATWTSFGGSCAATLNTTASVPAETVKAEGNVNVYPNPANDIFMVTAAEKYDYFSIYDITGNRIQHNVVASKQITVNLTGYPAGIYIIQLVGKPGVTTKKIILN